VKAFEGGGGRKLIANNLNAIRKALEGAGITLIFDPNGRAVGVSGTISTDLSKP